MKRNVLFKLLSSVLAGVCVILYGLAPVAAVDPDEFINRNESENNNTYSSADVTYDDYNNYGRITTEDDVDWWCITALSDGMANFWLGEIPTGCNFNLALYKGNGTSAIVISNNSGRKQELIRCHVYAGEKYYIRISSSSGYSVSSYYKFRYKRSDISDAIMFVTNSDDINTIPTVTNSAPYISAMGFTLDDRPNRLAPEAYDALPTSDIFVIRNHANAGLIRLDNGPDASNRTRIYANYNSNMSSDDRAVSTYSSTQLSEVEFVGFTGCYTGITHETYGNLVDIALSKGAKCAIGWTDAIITRDANRWYGQLFNYCSQGYNLKVAIALTNSWIRNNEPSDADAITSQYTGSSPLDKTVLALPN